MSNGLEDVVAAETILSDVDGLAGRLIIRGQPLETLAGRMTYEDMLGLLWDGFFPDLPSDLSQPLAKARLDVYRAIERELPFFADRPIYDGIRALMARLPDGTELDTALLLAAAPSVLLPALVRLHTGKPPRVPDTSLGHAADMLSMLGDAAPAPARAAALDAYLVTVVDHGLNASTFAARVVASTLAGLNSSALAALGALKGPRHGGALGPVLDMLDAIGKPENAAAWIENELTSGRRLMGFGHRIYRVRDPRADALKAALDRLAQSGAVDTTRIALATHVEAAALAALARHKPGRVLATNVEFYPALLLEALGFPRETFTAIFAASRIGGWIAHAKEEAATGKLIRPQSRYVGPGPRQAA
ncbi:citrate synthase [Devosia sp. CN2-171]|jgi:citrate synthase|uniref:citrate synthase n=1 Tax=Devosia sp. CN2-171 TaxID=3400909 RepID=UPI003BF85EB5